MVPPLVLCQYTLDLLELSSAFFAIFSHAVLPFVMTLLSCFVEIHIDKTPFYQSSCTAALYKTIDHDIVQIPDSVGGFFFQTMMSQKNRSQVSVKAGN